MLNLLRRVTSRPTYNRPNDDRRPISPRGPLVAMLERDLANLDNLTRMLPAPKR